MRIDGKRASEYRSVEIEKMLKSGVSYFELERLTKGQAYELRKVLAIRRDKGE